MSTRIVTVNVSQTISGTPSGLQQMSALVSAGMTNLSPGEPALLTESSDLSDFLGLTPASFAVRENGDSYLAMLGITDGMTSFLAGDSVELTTTGFTPEELNGTWTAQLASENIIIWDISATSTDVDVIGTFSIKNNVTSLETAADAFFAQGSSVGVYVIELGSGLTVPEQISALKKYIDEPLTRFYAYHVPRSWDGDADFISLAKLHTSNESMLYFFVLTDTPADTNSVSPYAGIKSVIAAADPSYPDTNAAVAAMWNFVSAAPSEVNKVPPMAFRFLQAVNAHPGKNSILKRMQNQNINYVDTGAEGGISNTILVNGVTSDGNDMTYWYSVDWVQINANMSLANAVINGSNNPINPLYYNQDGIDRLQLVAQGVFDTGGSYGLVNGAPVVNAIKFKTYTKNNPNDYAKGRYAGLSATYTPMRGFTEIVFNINVTMQLS